MDIDSTREDYRIYSLLKSLPPFEPKAIQPQTGKNTKTIQRIQPQNREENNNKQKWRHKHPQSPPQRTSDASLFHPASTDLQPHSLSLHLLRFLRDLLQGFSTLLPALAEGIRCFGCRFGVFFFGFGELLGAMDQVTSGIQP